MYTYFLNPSLSIQRERSLPLVQEPIRRPCGVDAKGMLQRGTESALQTLHSFSEFDLVVFDHRHI